MVYPAAEELDDTVMSHSGELLLSHAPAAGDYGVAPQIDRQVTLKAFSGRRMDGSDRSRAPPATIYSVFTADGCVVTVLKQRARRRITWEGLT
jgi:hypothetical protein